MKPSVALASNRAAIRKVVELHRAGNARVFGSVLRGEDTVSSDLDILIDPTPETTLMDVAAIQVELQRLLGVSVDVLNAQGLARLFGVAGFTLRLCQFDQGPWRPGLSSRTCHKAIEPIDRIDRYTADMDKASFLKSDLVQDVSDCATSRTSARRRTTLSALTQHSQRSTTTFP